MNSTLTIDLRMLYASGIGTYMQNVVPLIIKAYPDVEFNLIGDVKQFHQVGWLAGKNTTFVECNSPIYSVAEQYEVPRKIPKDTALFWSPHYNIPLLYRGKMLVTVCDLFHLAMPKLVGGFHRRLYASVMFNAVRKKADAIITISHFTKKELIRFTREGPQEIYPIHLGVDESWFNIERNNNPHNKPFLLYVGNVKPHKNLISLIRAFGAIAGRIPHDLVIIGKKEGFITGDKIVASEAARLGNRVYLTGYVEDQLLRQYFAHADALVFPSLYEGFGLPPLEAMAAGCPVIVSNAASLPEVCGNAVIYCDPYSYEDMAEKILQLISNASLREALKNKGVEQARKFTWGKCANDTVEIIGGLLNE